jgi:N-methylhydantoinase B
MTTAASRPSTSEVGVETRPVLTAILANRFDAIVREMTNTLFRTGRSSVLNTARDFSCCIVTSDDQLLSAAEGLQAHVLGAGLQTRWMTRLHDDVAEGDAYLHNDPHIGNTHGADHTILVPVFVEGQHFLTVSAKAHQADCGNSAPSTYMPFARDVYEEGLLTFPCVRVQRNYEDVEDIIRMCRARIRVPDMWYGDYLAAVGAVRVGERRVKQLVEKYGVETLQAFMAEWFDYSERRIRQAIGELPAAEMRASSTHDLLPGDDDQVTVNVRVTIEPVPGRIVVDLQDNVDCRPFGLNLSESCAMAGALVGVFNCLPASVPHNAGSFRCIDVLIRKGSTVGGLEFPFSASMATTNLLNRLINAVQVAFTSLGDGEGLAEGAGALGVGFGVVSGNDQRAGGKPYVNEVVIGNNGGPGGPEADGWVTYAMPDCAKAIYIDSIEVLEQKYPLRFRSFRLLEDSGGAGRHRGAPASETIYGPTGDSMQVFYFADFAEHPPTGVLGGGAGSAASVSRLERDGREAALDPIGDTTLEPGEWVRGCEAGGGGYGDPLTRPVEAVVDDVRDGWVSPKAAYEHYAVVVEKGAVPGAVQLDGDATERLRSERGATRTADTTETAGGEPHAT